MKVTAMKSIHGGGSHLLRTTTIPHVPGHCRGSDDLTDRATAVTLSAVVAAIIALYAVMFVALYHWSRYAPILPPDGAGETATMQLIE